MATMQYSYDPVKLAQQNNTFNAQEAAKQRAQEMALFQMGNNFNASEAAKNRNWQEVMSNSAHQREIADLKAAGLNPVLSATGGNGATVGSGATASSIGAPSLSKAEADTSANAALATLYNASLQYEAQLRAIDTNARTNLQIARETAAATRYNSDRNAAASMYNAALNAATQTGISTRQLEQNMKLAQYDYEKQMAYRGFDRDTQQQILEQKRYNDEYMRLMYPNNVWQAASALGHKVGMYGSPLTGFLSGLMNLFEKKRNHSSSTHRIINSGKF